MFVTKWINGYEAALHRAEMEREAKQARLRREARQARKEEARQERKQVAALTLAMLPRAGR